MPTRIPSDPPGIGTDDDLPSRRQPAIPSQGTDTSVSTLAGGGAPAPDLAEPPDLSEPDMGIGVDEIAPPDGGWSAPRRRVAEARAPACCRM